MKANIKVISPRTPEELAETKQLLEEYVVWLGEDLCFQNIDDELSEFPHPYTPPGGALRLAMFEDQALGAVALKPLEEGVCEMKRMFVRPAYWGSGAGRKLAEAIVDDARSLGYKFMRLDTLERLKPACALYERLGFYQIKPYNDNPLDLVRFYEFEL